MNVSLTPTLEQYVRRKVATGLYNNVSEVVREALRLMAEREGDAHLGPRKEEIVSALKDLEPELRRRGIVSVALFGSVVRGEAKPDSDVDVLVAVDPAASFDLLDLVGIKNLIGETVRREVDVIEEGSIKPRVRDGILAEAETVF